MRRIALMLLACFGVLTITTGCSNKEPVIYVPQKCEVNIPSRPELADCKSQNDFDVAVCKQTNLELCKLYANDLKSALDACK